MKKVNRRQQLHENYPACKELIIKRVVAHGPFHCSFGVRKLIRMKRIKKLKSRALVPWISISISRSINCYQCHQPYKGCHWEPGYIHNVHWQHNNPPAIIHQPESSFGQTLPLGTASPSVVLLCLQAGTVFNPCPAE